MAAFVKWMAGRLGNSGGIIPEDLDRALENACRPPNPSPSNPKAHIPASNFVRITELLHYVEQRSPGPDPRWRDRPRIYAVLRNIKRLDTMQAFIDMKYKDAHLPLDPRQLPDALGDQKTDFQRHQEHVHTRAIEMETGEGQHLTLQSGDDHFKSLKTLGKGGFSTVDSVISRLSWGMYARKRIVRRHRRGEQYNIFHNEISTLKRLKYHHLISIKGTYTDSIYFAILMRPIADGDMNNFLDKASNDPSLLPALRPHFGCIAGTVAYLHQKKVLHMDLKLENILIYKDQIFITDFGTARDWSNSGKSTTQTPVTAWTERYIPPELAKNLRAPRNSSTDMWSLGVVFLEMVSVLRGKSVKSFREHLKANGSKHPFVHGNTEATFSWFEILQTSTFESLSDNEPLIWVKDLIEEKAHNRPTAQELLLQIFRSASAEQWQGVCCIDADLTQLTEDITRKQASNGAMNNGIPAVFAPPTKEAFGVGTLSTPKMNAILNWQSHTDFDTPNQLPGSWSEDEQTQAETQNLIEVTEDNSTATDLDLDQRGWNTAEQESDNTQAPYELTEDETTITHAAMDWVHDGFAHRLSEIDLLNHDDQARPPRPQDTSTGVFDSNELYEIEYDSDSDKVSSSPSEVTVQPFSDIDESEEPEEPWRAMVDSGSVSEVQLTTCTIGEGAPILPPQLDLAGHPRLKAVIVHELSGPPVKQPKAHDVLSDARESIQGENVQIAPVLNPQPSIAHQGAQMLQKKTASKVRISHDTHQSQGDNHFSGLMQNGKVFTSKSQNVPSANDLQSTDQIESSAVTKDATSSPSILTWQSDDPRGKDSLKYRLGCRVDFAEKTEKWVRSDENQEVTVAYPSSEYANIISQEPPAEVAQLRNDSEEQNLDSTGSARPAEEDDALISKPMHRLTLGNLDAFVKSKHNDTVGGEEGLSQWPDFSSSPTTAKLSSAIHDSGLGISAPDYIAEVFKAESEAATSVVSLATKQKLGVNLGMTRLWDRDYNLLTTYAKSGKAGAVRELLLDKCNPGTRKKPRPGPLLAAVNGGTERHNKCVRLLLEHGADANVSRRGKPALHIAIEQQAFKGYTTLIMLLLMNGANPDSTDASGDTALLKLLGGGYEPLQIPRRNAMTLLISYKADVHIGPKGTLQKPIHLAVRRNDPWAVSFLLHGGAKVDERDGAGQTPFAMAASALTGKATENQKETLRQLLLYKADVDEQIGVQKNTALHIAVTLDDMAIASMLVTDYGAKMFIANDRGMTARALMQEKVANGECNDEVQSVLLELLSTTS